MLHLYNLAEFIIKARTINTFIFKYTHKKEQPKRLKKINSKNEQSLTKQSQTVQSEY